MNLEIHTIFDVEGNRAHLINICFIGHLYVWTNSKMKNKLKNNHCSNK